MLCIIWSQSTACACFIRPGVYFTKTLLSFHRNIELKTSKHEFPDRIHQNKQGFEGKKLSEGQARRNSLRFNNMCCRLHIGTQRFLLFSYLDFRVFFCLLSSKILKIICLTCIWSKFVDTSFHPSQNPQQNSSRRDRHFYQIWKSLREAQNSLGTGTRHIQLPVGQI